MPNTANCVDCNCSPSGGCAWECVWICKYGCGDKCTGCNDSCRNTCSGCSGSCSGGCRGGCNDNCASNCSGDCKSCTGTCSNYCNYGCSGNTVATAFANMLDSYTDKVMSVFITSMREVLMHEVDRFKGSNKWNKTAKNNSAVEKEIIYGTKVDPNVATELNANMKILEKWVGTKGIIKEPLSKSDAKELLNALKNSYNTMIKVNLSTATSANTTRRADGSIMSENNYNPWK